MDNSPKPHELPGLFLRKHAVTFKLVWVLFLVLILLIPMALIRSVLHERTNRHQEAVAEITSAWGGQQVVVGPVLVIPYRYKVKQWQERQVNGKLERVEVEETRIANASFLPSEFGVIGRFSPDRLHRGIYEAVVYRGELVLAGRFPAPDFAALEVSPADVLWHQAVVTMAVSDLRGTGDVLEIDLGVQKSVFAPGCRLGDYRSGITAPVPGLTSQIANLPFRLILNLKGSEGIRFAPLGQQNRVDLTSPWSDPSFQGAFLPEERQIDRKGFVASWLVSCYGRNYPQQATDRDGARNFSAELIAPSLFGVDFISPVDSYRLVERATKYAVLFIALVFAAFFLYEALAKLRIHTVQYTLVGAALCLFFLGVLALSEFLPFYLAYWTGAFAAFLLIVLYSLKVLGSEKRTAIVAGELLIIYAYLYIVLQLQDYSLLLGTAALFIVLAAIMYATRNLDWANRE